MKNIFTKLIFVIQVVIFKVASYLFNFKKKKKAGVVIGVEEIASILHTMGSAIPNSVTVNFNKNKYYDHRYNYDLSVFTKSRILKALLSPFLLAYLSSKYKTFIYISGAGFIHNNFDGREYEFKLLKKLRCNIICCFTGSDIRSFNLADEYAQKHGVDLITTYQSISHTGINAPEKELIRKKLANTADNYADAIFNPKVDQISYIQQHTHPFLYFADESAINRDSTKFTEGNEVTIVHAPSSPIIKGTPLVRAAIKKLKEEGYSFKYIELINVPNKQVLDTLSKAHIVLNEFYAFVPGVFGIEAMMNNTVLLTSADKRIETTLFGNANEAWVVTPYWLIYDKLKEQLHKPMSELKVQADKGTKWVEQYCTYTFSAKYLNNVINSIEND